MAVGIRQQVDPSYLLRRAIWEAQGWRLVKGPQVLRQLPVYSDGTPLVRTQVDAIEWVDVQVFGIGNADDAVSRLRDEIQRRGSDLYAYALLKREIVNFLGVHTLSYRLVLLHSLVQLLGWAIAIMAIAFAAIIFIQYMTVGRSAALSDLQQFWGGLITNVGDAAGTAAGGIAQPFIWIMLAAGVVAIALAKGEQAAGVKTGHRVKAPSGSIGVRAGPVTGRVGS